VGSPFSGYLGSIAPTDAAARSSKIVGQSFGDLTSFDGYVNVHESVENLGNVVSQGNVGANADGSSGSGGGGY